MGGHRYYTGGRYSSSGRGSMGSRNHSRKKQIKSPPKTQASYTFAVDERVLCYEPDRNKARVLYDSKVLEAVERRDGKGNTTVEYKIHFSGWNSSWDRYVAEDCVLKDTQENRELQRELKEKADILLQNHLKKNKRKKPLNEILKEGKDRPGKSSRYVVTYNKNKDYDRSSGSDSSDPETSEDEEDRKITARIILTEAMKVLLQQDLNNVTKNSMLLKLPAGVPIVYIFELYVKYIGFRELHKMMTRRKPCLLHGMPPPVASTSAAALSFSAADKMQPKTPTEGIAEDIAKISRKVRQAQEIVHGLKTIFDFMAYRVLLYDQENDQYKALRKLKGKMPEVNCLGMRTRFTEVKNGVLAEIERLAVAAKIKASSKKDSTSGVKTADRSSEQNLQEPKLQSVIETTIQPRVIKLQPDPQPWSNMVDRYIKDLLAWRVLPAECYEQKHPDPCMMYGIVHLIRLFVKLPDIINRTSIPRRKVRIIAHHVNQMVEHISVTYNFYDQAKYIKIVAEPKLQLVKVSSRPLRKVHRRLKMMVDPNKSASKRPHSSPNKTKSQQPKKVEAPVQVASDALEEHQLTVSNEYICKKDAIQICSTSPVKEITNKNKSIKNGNESRENTTSGSADLMLNPISKDAMSVVIKIEPNTYPEPEPCCSKRLKEDVQAPRYDKVPSPQLPRMMRKSAADSAFKTAYIFASQQNAPARVTTILTADQIKREPGKVLPRKRSLSKGSPVLVNETKRHTRITDRPSDVPTDETLGGIADTDDKPPCSRNSRQKHRSPTDHSNGTISKSPQNRNETVGHAKSKDTKNECAAGKIDAPTSINTSSSIPRKSQTVVVERRILPIRIKPVGLMKSLSPPRRSYSAGGSKEVASPGKSPSKYGSQPSTTLRLRSRSDERQLRSKGALINALSLPMLATPRSVNRSPTRRESCNARDSGVKSTDKPCEQSHNLRRHRK